MVAELLERTNRFHRLLRRHLHVLLYCLVCTSLDPSDHHAAWAQGTPPIPLCRCDPILILIRSSNRPTVLGLWATTNPRRIGLLLPYQANCHIENSFGCDCRPLSAYNFHPAIHCNPGQSVTISTFVFVFDLCYHHRHLLCKLFVPPHDWLKRVESPHYCSCRRQRISHCRQHPNSL